MNRLAKVKFDLVEAHLLLVLNIALVVLVVGVRAHLPTHDEVEHRVRLEAAVRVCGVMLPSSEAPVGFGSLPLHGPSGSGH